MPLTADDAITSPEDPAPDTGGKSSRYFGVFRIKRVSGAELWRVKVRYAGKSYHVGEFKKEIDAALIYDNVAWYISREFRSKLALLNFPKTYSSDETRPPQWFATKRILRKIKSQL